MKKRQGVFLPTKKQIQVACGQIQRSWDDRTERMRSRRHCMPAKVMFIPDDFFEDLPAEDTAPPNIYWRVDR